MVFILLGVVTLSHMEIVIRSRLTGPLKSSMKETGDMVKVTEGLDGGRAVNESIMAIKSNLKQTLFTVWPSLGH